MANMKELSDQLRKLSADQENDNERIALAFEIMELYCTMKKRNKADMVICCYAATILSGIVQKGLASKARTFLEKYDHKLPPRAVTLLRASHMRMGGY